MADVMPNYQLEQQRLRFQIVTQEQAIEKNKLDIMEMEDRKQRHLENMNAAKDAIAGYKKSLASLEQAHGKLKEG